MTDVRKIVKPQISRISAQWERRYCMRTDGQTDMKTGRYDEVNKHFKHSLNMPKNSFSSKLYLTMLHKYMYKCI